MQEIEIRVVGLRVTFKEPSPHSSEGGGEYGEISSYCWISQLSHYL